MEAKHKQSKVHISIFDNIQVISYTHAVINHLLYWCQFIDMDVMKTVAHNLRVPAFMVSMSMNSQ